MNNNNTKQDLNAHLFRPKRLYITSEDVNDYDDAGSCRFILAEPIIPAEGFKLVYGLASFGYSATANNISTRQKNNMLCFKLTYLPPEFIYVPSASGGNMVLNEDRTEKICYQKLIIPDGNYGTLDELFSVLNNKHYNQIKSSIKKNIVVEPTTEQSKESPEESWDSPNDISFEIHFGTTTSGFSIGLALGQYQEINNDYYVHGSHYQAYEVNNIPLKLEIIPGDDTTLGLYKLLFTNKEVSIDKACNITTALPIQSENPPQSIRFDLFVNLSYQVELIDPPDRIDPNEGFHYFVLTADQKRATYFDETIQDPFDGTHDTLENACLSNIFLQYRDVPFQSYYPPRLFPLYVEVTTNLETQNLTIDGFFSNLLCRHFPIGADQGATSFFQQWDTPVMHYARSARNVIDSIKVDFNSEKQMWVFFNLTFFLEIVFYEVAEEEELPQFTNEPFEVPGDDAMTAQLQQFSKSFSNPFPIHNRSEVSGNLKLGSLRSSSHKRSRK